MSRLSPLFITRHVVLAGALLGTLPACGDKQAEELKAAAAEAQKVGNEAAKAAADQAAEAQAAATKLQEEAAKAVSSKKDELKQQLKDGLDAADRKVTYLREKGAKLKGAAKKKADEAFAAYDAAKASASELGASIDGLADLPSAAAIGTKLSDALKAVGVNVEAAESAALPKK